MCRWPDLGLSLDLSLARLSSRREPELDALLASPAPSARGGGGSVVEACPSLLGPFPQARPPAERQRGAGSMRRNAQSWHCGTEASMQSSAIAAQAGRSDPAGMRLGTSTDPYSCL